MAIVDVMVERKKEEESKYMKGVRHLCESGVTRVPNRYIFPAAERADVVKNRAGSGIINLKQLPIIDLAMLQTPNRPKVIESLAKACQEYGFFHVVNHGISMDVIRRMTDASRRFFELPYEERKRYMSPDIRAPVRYGTSLNQVKDEVFCWRDFLKMNCHPLDTVAPHWPSSPVDLREEAMAYVKENKNMFSVLMGAILETLGLEAGIVDEFEEGTHMMVVNYYPPCPEPSLTLGMPPHSDYGFLTLLLQDEVEGLQVQHKGEWITVEPVAGSFVVNVGDHLEIFSNGRYKSVLHRVMVNALKSRISIASLHSLPFQAVIQPSPGLVSDDEPRLYKDTDFASFLEYLTSCEPKHKNFLESRKLTFQRTLPKSQ